MNPSVRLSVFLSAFWCATKMPTNNGWGFPKKQNKTHRITFNLLLVWLATTVFIIINNGHGGVRLWRRSWLLGGVEGYCLKMTDEANVLIESVRQADLQWILMRCGYKKREADEVVAILGWLVFYAIALCFRIYKYLS